MAYSLSFNAPDLDDELIAGTNSPNVDSVEADREASWRDEGDDEEGEEDEAVLPS